MVAVINSVVVAACAGLVLETVVEQTELKLSRTKRGRCQVSTELQPAEEDLDCPTAPMRS